MSSLCLFFRFCFCFVYERLRRDLMRVGVVCLDIGKYMCLESRKFSVLLGSFQSFREINSYC